MSGSSEAVRIRGLEKRFGPHLALDGLDMTVPRGAFYAFLGPNGAGKSTTLSILTGVLGADAGEIDLLGLDPTAAPLEVKRRIGIVPEELALFERLTGRQYLTFCARMYGLDGKEAQRRGEELLALTELEARSSALVAEYSKGMRRRLAIAAALVHAPPLLFLDEPFEGIDVLASGVIRALLAELSRRGVTVVLTTHILEVAEQLASHVGLIHCGRMQIEGPLPELLREHEASSLREVFESAIGIPAARGGTLSFFESPNASASESGS